MNNECSKELTTWMLISCSAIEAAWGILQVYGYESSNHALYALTGSFYNPGPYSGFLALVLPLCLHEWLNRKKSIGSYTALTVMLLVLCVLPAGMSRTAWIAAAISSGYVYGMHRREAIKDYIHRHRKRVIALAVMGCLLGGMALGGIYHLKKDSADGRLFLWKIAARAVCEQPWTGYGWNHVPAAYGEAQEAYFAAGDYTLTEEYVAGAPEYVFNEYLQVALAWGVPALCLGLLIIGGGFYIGHRHGAYGLCGGLLSLAVFAFASYPLQFPLFVAALGILLACLYADSACYQREKLERMVRIVQEKEPKVKSTAIRQMRQKAGELLKK